MTQFEGHRPADDFAQMQAKKTSKDHYTLKSNVGGLNYVVVDSKDKIKDTDKILSHFNDKGERVKG